jgi:flagellar hook-length control protein FliK
MMQSIASTKSDIAAFAAVGDQNDSAALYSEFEQIFLQQTKQQSATKTTQQNVSVEREASNSVTAKSVAMDETQAKTEGVNTGPKEVVRSESKNERNDTSLIAEISDPDQQSPSALRAIEIEDGAQVSEDEQKVEDWLALVNELQLLAADEDATIQEQNNSSELLALNEGSQVNGLPVEDNVDVDESNILTLLNSLTKNQDLNTVLSTAGFTSVDDFKQKLSELAAKHPSEFAAVMAELKAGHAIGQVMSDLTKIEQNAIDLNATEAPIKDVKSQLQSFAADVALLLENKQLSDSDVKLLQQALYDSINKDHPINPELVELVQSKLSSLGKDGINSDSPVKMATAAADTSSLQTNILSYLLGKINPSDTAGLQKAKIDIPATELQSENRVGSLLSDSAEEKKDIDLMFATKVGTAEMPTAIESNNKSKLTNVGTVDSSLANSLNMDKLTANKVAQDSELKALIALPKEKLDEALVNIAQRVATLLADDVKAQQKNSNVIKLTSDALVPTTSDGTKDVLAALKAGVSEFKAQLAAGREPGIDLNALVNQAIAKTSDADVSVQMAKSLEQSLAGLSQALSIASQLEESSQRQHTLATMDVNLDKLLTQAELAKIQTQSQVESKLDKAINLTKPEAHQQLAEKVRWMVNTNNLIAEIRLDPAELGSMHVKVSLSGESASVSFVVQSHQTRDALETATPRLRDMLAEKGIELGQSTVRQDSQAKQDNQGQAQQQAKANQRLMTDNEGLVNDEALMGRQAINHRQDSGGIDYFV